MKVQRRVPFSPSLGDQGVASLNGFGDETLWLLEAAPDATVVVDQSGNIIWSNSKTESLFRCESKELNGEQISRVLPELPLARIPNELHSSLRESSLQPGQLSMLSGRRSDGSILFVDVSFSPLNQSGESYIWLSIRETSVRSSSDNKSDGQTYSRSLIEHASDAQGGRDNDGRITEQEARIKKLNEELEQRILELESFSYSVSHDLRAPLRGIDGFIGIFLSKYLDQVDAEGQRLLEKVRRNVSKMGTLIDELLALSRIGMKDIQITTIDMFELVHTVLEELSESKGNCSIVIKRLVPAQGDMALIKQVLVNLISNAFKYSAKRKKPVIEIGCYPDEDETQYYIRDNGVGFDMEFSDKLFGVFQRLHDPQEYQGTGVGLAIVKRIINRHGGSVWAVGKENEGATFYFSLKSIPDAKDAYRRVVS